MLIRKAYPEIPPRVEYSLSEYGKKYCPSSAASRFLGEYSWKRTNEIMPQNGCQSIILCIN